MELNREQIINGDYKYPDKLVELKYTNHFKKRLEERGLTLECIPTMVRVTKDNIHAGRTTDGKRLKSVVIRLDYNNKYMFIVLNPFDGAAKSLWFNDKNTKKHGSKSNRSTTS